MLDTLTLSSLINTKEKTDVAINIMSQALQELGCKTLWRHNEEYDRFEVACQVDAGLHKFRLRTCHQSKAQVYQRMVELVNFMSYLEEE